VVRSLLHAFRDYESTLLHCSDEHFVIGRALVGVGDGEFRYGIVEVFAVATIAIQHAGVTSARVSLAKDLAAHLGIFAQTAAFEILGKDGGDGGLVIGELAHKIVTSVHSGPAKKDIGLRLHQPLSLHDTFSLVARNLCLEILRISGRRLFLDLQEKRVFAAIAKAQDDVVARANAARSDDFKRDVHRHVAFEKVASLLRKRVAIAPAVLSARRGKFCRKPPA